MTCKPSAEMRDLIELLEKNPSINITDAAKQVGLHPNSVYKSSVYKNWKLNNSTNTKGKQ